MGLFEGRAGSCRQQYLFVRWPVVWGDKRRGVGQLWELRAGVSVYYALVQVVFVLSSLQENCCEDVTLVAP